MKRVPLQAHSSEAFLNSKAFPLENILTFRVFFLLFCIKKTVRVLMSYFPTFVYSYENYAGFNAFFFFFFHVQNYIFLEEKRKEFSSFDCENIQINIFKEMFMIVVYRLQFFSAFEWMVFTRSDMK